MKIKWKLFSKSFLLAFLTFAVLSTIIITSLYLDANAVDPLNKESTVLIGLTEKDKVLSLCIINFDPQNDTIKFLPIPDNVWISNGTVLQNQYDKRKIADFRESLEKLIGAKIDRYIMLTTENIVDINSHMGQDISDVSLSNIGFAYLKTFLDSYAKAPHIEKLADILSTKSFLKSTHTNLSKKEMKAYCELLSQYILMTRKTIDISGKYDTQPYSNTYFIPDNPQPDKNIFK